MYNKFVIEELLYCTVPFGDLSWDKAIPTSIHFNIFDIIFIPPVLAV